jgi:hypothetical protein
MPPSELSDTEAADLYFRRGLSLLLGVPITAPVVAPLARLCRQLALYLAHRPSRWAGTVVVTLGRNGHVEIGHSVSAPWEAQDDTRATG